MYVAIGILLLMFMGITIGRSLYYKNWVLIYTAYGNEEYFGIIAKLKAEGVKHRTHIPNKGFDNRVERFKDHSQFDVYVKKEDEHKAVKALKKN